MFSLSSKRSGVCIVALTLYIQLPHRTQSSYEAIWFDSMDVNNNDWIATNIDVEIGDVSDGCFDNQCTKMASTNYGEAGIYRNTDISDYSSIRLKFDASNYGLESGDECYVYYAYDSFSNKQMIESYTGGGNGIRVYFDNQVIDLPSSPQSTQIWIFFEIIGTSTDYCYWDNVELQGIPLTTDPYQTIWFDDMDISNNDDWIATNDDVVFGSDSTGCFDNQCTLLKSINYGESGIHRSTDISDYSSIRLKFDASNYGLESGDECYVYYAYDSDSYKQIESYTGGDSGIRVYFDNQVIDLPSSPQSTQIWLLFEIIGTGLNYCYWDNVELQGIPVTSNPTPQPTTPPTLDSTLLTKHSSSGPTNNPTILPTLYPTIKTTNYPPVAITETHITNPSRTPTDRNIISVTADTSTILPTIYPTIKPTNYLSVAITETYTTNPSKTPTNGNIISVTTDTSTITISIVVLLAVVMCAFAIVCTHRQHKLKRNIIKQMAQSDDRDVMRIGQGVVVVNGVLIVDDVICDIEEINDGSYDAKERVNNADRDAPLEIEEVTRGQLQVRVMNRTPGGSDNVIVGNVTNNNDKDEESSSFTMNEEQSEEHEEKKTSGETSK